MKYRKKPVVVEAQQFDPANDYDEACSVVSWCGGTATDVGCVIPTLEGITVASPGDFVIKGVHGEFYACKPDIFAKTYEAVE